MTTVLTYFLTKHQHPLPIEIYHPCNFFRTRTICKMTLIFVFKFKQFFNTTLKHKYSLFPFYAVNFKL